MAGPSVSISLSNNGTTNSLSLSWSTSWNGSPTGKSVSVSYPGGSSSAESGSLTVSGLSAGTNYSASISASAFYSTFGEVLSASSSSSATTSSPPPPPTYPPSWSDNTLAGFQADVAYSDGVSATNMNYSGSYSVSAGTLPSGVSLNASTGAVTGTPTTAGQSYSFTITAGNSYGSVSQAFSGTVAASPTAGKLRVWTGTTWVVVPAKVWDGAGWVAGSVKVWNGTAWVTSV